MKKQQFIYLFVSLLLMFVLGIKVSAAEMNFSVQANIPSNQVDKSQSYFDLRMKPNQSQDLTVEMTNNSDEQVTIEVLPNTAITNQNGIVEYNNTTTKKDNTLKTSFSEIASSEKEVTIPAKSKKNLTVHIQMPKNEYDGVILGGIYFTEKTNTDSSKKSTSSQIVNRYAYVIGVKLTENDNVVNPELRLTSVNPKQVNYRNVVAANIQNYTASIIKDLSIEGSVYQKGSNKPLYTTSKDNLRMAPNSNFDFAVSLNNETFKAGKYTFKGIAKSGKKTWKFEKDFEIKGTAAKKYNKNAVSLKKESKNIGIFFVVGLIVLLLLLIIIIIILLRKLRKSENSYLKEV